MKRSPRIAVLLSGFVGVVCAACASEAPGEEDTKALSPEMRQAIEAFVDLQDVADPSLNVPSASKGSSGTVRSSSSDGVGGIDPTKLSGALRAGATGIPAGGAASSARGAGNGGIGSGAFGAAGLPAGSAGAGNGGIAPGPAGMGGLASFADAACYLLKGLCSYVARCAGSSASSIEVCAVPASCPSLVAAALAESNATIPPQAVPVIRCFGDALGSAPCVRDKLATGLRASFARCGLPADD